VQSTDGTFRSDTVRTDTDTLRSRPFFGLDLRGEKLKTSVNVQRNAFDQGGTTFIQDSFGTVLDWTPDRLPSVRVRYLENESRDEDRLGIDNRERSVRLQSDYAVTDELHLDYRGSVQETDNRIDGANTRATAHLVKAGYGERLWDGRVTINAEMTSTWRRLEASNRGVGEVTLPTFPDRGLFALTDTPEFDALGEIPGLIDGNRGTPAGPDLGLQPPGADDRPRNLGVEYPDPTRTRSPGTSTSARTTACGRSTPRRAWSRSDRSRTGSRWSFPRSRPASSRWSSPRSTPRCPRPPTGRTSW
jgi:hypothetical protein